MFSYQKEIQRRREEIEFSRWVDRIRVAFRADKNNFEVRTSTKKGLDMVIILMITNHQPYRLIKHGAGLVTLTTKDVEGPCLVCGKKDNLLCRLLK